MTSRPGEGEVVVRGEGQARTMPDRAVVRVTVEGEGPSRDAAYDEAARFAGRVDDVIAGHRAGIDRVTTAALVVQPKTRWRKGEEVRTGWRASRISVVEAVDLGRLGELMAELTGAGGTLAGPFWQLDPTNPVHGEARRLAAEDARRRAEEYAAALGLDLTDVAWVAEPAIRGALPDAAMALSARSLQAAPSSGGPEEVVDVAPEEMTVRAAVDVGFSFGGASKAADSPH